MFQRFCVDVTSFAVILSPTTNRKVSTRETLWEGGERNHDVFTRITVSRWEFQLLIRIWTSWLHPISSISRFFFFFFAPPIPEIFSSGMRGKNIFLARISLHARPIKKQDAYFLGRTVHFPDVLDVDPTLRKSVNHPRGKLARASGDRRGWTRDTRLTVAEEPSGVCGGNEGVDISARAP